MSDTDNSRSGRWTDGEIAFVDYLVEAFDKGGLPLPEGTKLSTFLGDILLCKASRLTKKMKNAKLSTRSFERKLETAMNKKEDLIELSALQDRFIGSLQTKVAQLELKFNLVKQWRTYFSNLCVQMGFKNLHAGDWISSLEEMEANASKVEEQMRYVRRRRMGLSVNSNCAEVTQPPAKSARVERVISTTSSFQRTPATNAARPNVVRSMSDNPLSRHRSLSDDLDNAFASLYDPNASHFPNLFEEEIAAGNKTRFSPQNTTPSTDPFLDALTKYMERSHLPFQHADVWVPSFTTGNDKQVQLLHAGNATRKDQDGALVSKFANFGEFSKSFTFQPNEGLPGRVYASGKPEWEVHLSNPLIFQRFRGADAHGLRTATAVPISTPGVGRMVVVFYSTTKLMEDPSMVNRCVTELSSYSPAPKWKLVIEIGNGRGAKLKDSSPSIEELMPKSAVEDEVSVEVKQESDDGTGDEVVHKIIALLGNQMPLGESSPSSEDQLPYYMAIRLLLLRSPSKRTAEENDLIHVLKGSFSAHSRDKQRSSAQLARLLATEYMCLKSASKQGNSLRQPLPPQRSHIKDHQGTIRLSKTYSSTQLEVSRAFLPPLLAGRAMLRPATRLPNVVSHCNSTNDMSSMGGQSASMNGMALPTSTFTTPDLSSFNDHAPSF